MSENTEPTEPVTENTESTTAPATTPTTAPTIAPTVLITGTAAIRISDPTCDDQLAAQPVIIADLLTLSSGSPEAIARAHALARGENSNKQGDDITTEQLCEQLITHLRTHERYRVHTSIGVRTLGHRRHQETDEQAGEQALVVQITGAEIASGVPNLLDDLYDHVVHISDAPTPHPIPWASVTSLYTDEHGQLQRHDMSYYVNPADQKPVANHRSHSDQAEVIGHGLRAIPTASLISQGIHAIIADSMRRDNTLTETMSRATENIDPSQLRTNGATTSGGAASTNELSSQLAENVSDSGDIDALLGGILRAIAASIESLEPAEDEPAEDLDDRQSMVMTLTMAATMLEESQAHHDRGVNELIARNLGLISQRTEAALTDDEAITESEIGERLDQAGVNPATVSLAMATQMAAGRISQLPVASE